LYFNIRLRRPPERLSGARSCISTFEAFRPDVGPENVEIQDLTPAEMYISTCENRTPGAEMLKFKT